MILLQLMSYVSRPLAIKRKTSFLKIELKAFSNRGDSYGQFEKKLFKYLKNGRNGEEIMSSDKKTTVLRYERFLSFL